MCLESSKQVGLCLFLVYTVMYVLVLRVFNFHGVCLILSGIVLSMLIYFVNPLIFSSNHKRFMKGYSLGVSLMGLSILIPLVCFKCYGAADVFYWLLAIQVIVFLLALVILLYPRNSHLL